MTAGALHSRSQGQGKQLPIAGLWQVALPLMTHRSALVSDVDAASTSTLPLRGGDAAPSAMGGAAAACTPRSEGG